MRALHAVQQLISEYLFKAPVRSKVMLTFGVVLFILHVICISIFGTSFLGRLTTDSIHNLLFAAIVISSFGAYSRSRTSGSRFAARFWILATIASCLTLAASILWEYYDLTLGYVPISSSLAVLLATFDLSPLLVVLFLDEAKDPESVDWLQLLDLLQVAIVFLSAYLYVFYLAPMAQKPEMLGRTAFYIFTFRTVLLSALFIARGKTTPLTYIRTLYSRMGWVLAAYCLLGGQNMYHIWVQGAVTGTFRELGMTAALLIFALNAAIWVPIPEAKPSPRTAEDKTVVFATLFPLVLPLLVTGLAAQIPLHYAALVGFASFGCYGARSMILQRRQRTAMRSLSEAEARFRLLFEKNPEPMWVFDCETLKFLEANRAAVMLYGYSRDEFLQMKITEVRPAEDVPLLLDHIRTEGFSRYTRLRHRTKQGQILEVEVISEEIEFVGRRARLSLIEDKTAYKRLEDQFRQSQKMEAIGTLAGGIAHDFNNLLCVIIGYSSILQSSITDENAIRSLTPIQNSAQAAASLTRQLLAFSRKQIVQPAILDLSAIVSNVEKMLLRVIGENIELVTNGPADLGKVKADTGQMEQVIMNLAVNARDAMPRGGRLRIETSNIEFSEAVEAGTFGLAPGPYVVLAVSDTGTGMDKETQERIFEPFFTTKAEGRGTGLGLSTVYGIVKQNGGAIRVDSSPGSGTRFTVYLPQVKAVQEEGYSTEGSGVDPHGSETILVVEDDRVLRELCCVILREQGYTVLEASEGSEAERIAGHYGKRIHLLITDVIMPGVAVREFVADLKTKQPGLRVLFVSGYTDDAVLSQGILQCGLSFLEKPFLPETLTRKIREILDSPTHSK